MNRAAVDKRIAEIERQLGTGRQPKASVLEQLQWLGWCTDEELEWLEAVANRDYWSGIRPNPAERLRMIEIEAAATRKMIAGEPSVVELHRRP